MGKMQFQGAEKLGTYLKKMEIPARTLLLKEGQVSQAMYFIEKGCLRTWVNNDGKEITTQFFFEGESVSSFESFRANKPSLYSIESLESCVLHVLSKRDFDVALKQVPGLKQEMEDHLFKRLFQAQQHFYSYLKNTPQQRYEELIERFPHIIRRIPQHYIASYLGITSVSLSRIRNRR